MRPPPVFVRRPDPASRMGELVDLPTILPIHREDLGSTDFSAAEREGTTPLSGAEMQALHKDMRDFFHDPLGMVTFHDVPRRSSW